MSSVRKTYTLDAETADQLDQMIPSSDRSRFVNSQLAQALKEMEKQQTLSWLNEPGEMPIATQTASEVVREIREASTKKL